MEEETRRRKNTETEEIREGMEGKRQGRKRKRY